MLKSKESDKTVRILSIQNKPIRYDIETNKEEIRKELYSQFKHLQKKLDIITFPECCLTGFFVVKLNQISIFLNKLFQTFSDLLIFLILNIFQ